jgi:flagellar motor switch protein FliN/FliY
MVEINESIANFLRALTSELKELLSQQYADGTDVSWEPAWQEPPDRDLIWCSCVLSVDPACRVSAGASRETWENMEDAGDAVSISGEPHFGALMEALQRTAQGRFGSEVQCTGIGISQEPPEAWTTVSLVVVRGGRPYPSVRFALSPGLEAALGGADEASEPREAEWPDAEPTGAARIDILLHVEIPVTVSFGRTQMHLKDLLGLANGSIVALDRELSDAVEIRVNNCVVANGEVVAVDGNYGVRILEMASGWDGRGVRGALPDGNARAK